MGVNPMTSDGFTHATRRPACGVYLPVARWTGG